MNDCSECGAGGREEHSQACATARHVYPSLRAGVEPMKDRLHHDPVDALAVMDRLLAVANNEADDALAYGDGVDAYLAFAELIEAANRVRRIPSPVGTVYQHGTTEDRAYVEGFMYALRLVREPGFACGLDAALARCGVTS